MNNKYSIGIDIGGTNTDAVLVDAKGEIVAFCKTTTTTDIVTGFVKSITQLLDDTKLSPSLVQEILIGTTHATNALLEGKNLGRVGVIRIAGNKPLLPPCYAWPPQIRKTLLSGVVTINGGFECQGTSITSISLDEIKQAITTLLQQGAETFAIIGVFSPLNNEQELLVRKVVHEIMGNDFPVTISSDVAGVGFIERENSTILNAALQKSVLKGFVMLEKAVASLSINSHLFITQNNGTLISIEQALAYPVLTISAGPTNSFIGAARLANKSDAIVVDIGGTSTDVGIVLNSFPRRTVANSHIAGITLNFPMPDVISVPLGGGSYITHDDNQQWNIGPESSGRNVLKESYSFGGDCLTLTDVALVCKTISLDGARLAKVPLTQQQAQTIMQKVIHHITVLVNRISGSKQSLPVVIVGGGAELIPLDLFTNDLNICIPKHASIANAYGAALAEISGTVDTVISLTAREAALDILRAQAMQLAISRGADKNSTRIIQQQIIPFSYIPNNLARVIIIAAGKRIIMPEFIP